MQKFIFVLIFPFILFSCDALDKKNIVAPPPEPNRASIAPTSSSGRTNSKAGCMDLDRRDVVISIWDNGVVDGDIVSVYLNGKEIIQKVAIKGINEKVSVNVTLDYFGYNYIYLYAHNLGTSPPSTASVSIDDGVNSKIFVLSADLNTNDYVDLIVDGATYKVSCPPAVGRVFFWLRTNPNCSAVTVNSTSYSGTITAYYPPPSAIPSCGTPASVTFTLPVGIYTWSAGCFGSSTWGGGRPFTVTENGCTSVQVY